MHCKRTPSHHYKADLTAKGQEFQQKSDKAQKRRVGPKNKTKNSQPEAMNLQQVYCRLPGANSSRGHLLSKAQRRPFCLLSRVEDTLVAGTIHPAHCIETVPVRSITISCPPGRRSAKWG